MSDWCPRPAVDFGRDVICVDEERIKSRLFIPARLLSTSLGSTSSWRPRQGQDLSKPVGDADAVLIVAGTPSRHADLCYVYAAAEDIAQSLSGLTAW
jgi:UDPglucose 6-dehydrogenase